MTAGDHDRPSILFACAANGGRSVASKVLAEHYAGAAAAVSSAGSEPGDRVHPEVAEALSAAGLAVDGETPKGFDPDGRYTVVVTMGCGESCPLYAGARYEDWPLEDPKGQPAETVRRILADVDRRVRQLLRDLVPGLVLPPPVFERADGEGAVDG